MSCCRYPSPRALLLALAILGVGFVTRGDSPEEIGASLAAELRSQRPGDNSTNAGALRLRDAKNHRRTIPVTVTTRVAGDQWSVSYEAQLTNGATETVTARYGGVAPVYEQTVTPPGPGQTARPRALAPGKTAVPFAGSDFWVCDLGLEFLHWPTQRYVKQELSNGRMCAVLESINPSTNGYARVHSYIDQEFKGLLSAKAFDKRGFVIKGFSTGKFAKIHDRWFLRDIHIVDERSDSRTDLIYELPPE